MRGSVVRVLLNVLLMGSIVWLPWWTMLVAAIVLVARYRAYEVIFWGAVIDLLYGTSIAFLSTLACAALLLAGELIKPRLVFYDG